jgi:ribosomal protein S18 acetylase RimI-like enzyme
MLKAEVIRSIDDAVVTDTVLIDRISYPEAWAYKDAEEYYGKMLRKKNNIYIVLRDDERRVGFLFVIPHKNAVAELRSDDPLMEIDSATYYVENVAILSGYRNKKGFSKMFEILRGELRKRNIFKISMHARVSNNLSSNIQRNMNIIKIRRIDAWRYYGFEEPTDYIVATWPAGKEKSR